MCLGSLQCIYCVITSLNKSPCYKRRENIPGHVLRQPDLVQLKSAIRHHNTTPYSVHNRSEHLALERTMLGRLAECPLQQPFYGLLFKLAILGLVQTYKLFPSVI